eukprot:SM000052S17709  [mRNA]  locus=s52:208507:209059:+ [translate_table: standard]
MRARPPPPSPPPPTSPPSTPRPPAPSPGTSKPRWPAAGASARPPCAPPRRLAAGPAACGRCSASGTRPGRRAFRRCGLETLTLLITPKPRVSSRALSRRACWVWLDVRAARHALVRTASPDHTCDLTTVHRPA